jgi:primosomal protein N' (replication factor Y)
MLALGNYSNIDRKDGNSKPSRQQIIELRNYQEKLISAIMNKPSFDEIASLVGENDFVMKEKRKELEELKEKIKDRLDKKEQVILFHNRRGYANFIQCEQCGKVFKCPDCDISLKYHLSHKIMKCHYCGYSENIIMKCDDCGSYNFVYGSPGTEQIEIKLQELFPSAKILRMDSDTTRKKDSYNAMFDAMKSHKIDILLGTQMISKGLDFHNVTLVGVISAEITLNIPDFRSAERTFQLLTQVAGRSGRGDKKGEVIIQARNPNHYALTQASKQDFINFSYQEIPLRNDTKYPPKFKLARVLFSCNDYDYLKKYLETCDIISLIKKLKFNKEEFIIFPFVEAPLPKIKTKFRFHFIIKSLKSSYIQRFLNAFLRVYSCPKNINMTIDVDPLTLL